MLHHFQTANDACAVQRVIVPLQFTAEKTLLVREVALHHELSGKEVVARHLVNFALRTGAMFGFSIRVTHMSVFLRDQSTMVVEPMRLVEPICMVGAPWCPSPRTVSRPNSWQARVNPLG